MIKLYTRKKILALLYIFLCICIFFIFLSQYKYQSDRFFWLDEALTFKIGITGGILDTIKTGADITYQPPFFYLIGKLVSLFTQNPQYLRLTSFIPWIVTCGIFAYYIRRNITLLFLLFLFLFLSSFTNYILSEFRPYAWSGLLFVSIILLLSGETKGKNFWIYVSILLFLFASTLSLNIPVGVLLIGFCFFLLFLELWSKKSFSVKSFFSLASATFGILFWIVYLYQGTGKPFDWQLYRIHLVQNFQMLRIEIFLNSNILFFLPIVNFGIIAGFDKKWKNKLLCILLVGLYLLQVILPTFVLYNRIPWFAPRYSHLLYFMLPLSFALLYNSTKSIYRWNFLPSVIGIYVCLLLVFSRNAPYDIIPKTNGVHQNFKNSSWSKISENLECSGKVFLVPIPGYEETVATFHISNSTMDYEILHDPIEIKKKIKVMDCIVLTYAIDQKPDLEMAQFPEFKIRKQIIIENGARDEGLRKIIFLEKK